MVLKILGYLVIGAVAGWIIHEISKNRGVKVVPSVLLGIGGALLGTIISFVFDLAGTGYYAVMGAVALLFTVNAYKKEDKPILDKTDL